jgi:hypothetical protein
LILLCLTNVDCVVGLLVVDSLEWVPFMTCFVVHIGNHCCLSVVWLSECEHWLVWFSHRYFSHFNSLFELLFFACGWHTT